LGARAEISHENYDYVTSDLEIVVALLNTSIQYFEHSLELLYVEDIGGGTQELATAASLITPASELLDEAPDIADSYADLSFLIPPFSDFIDGEEGLIQTEKELLEAMVLVASLSNISSLEGEDAVYAMSAIDRASHLIGSFNDTIDSLIVMADEITALSVEETEPFSGNRLVELLEKLRELLIPLEEEIYDFMVDNDDLWESVEPFITFWISDSSLYLGDEIVGGGYLFFNGSFRSDCHVEIVMGDAVIAEVVTGALGRFDFSWEIPLNESLLGAHVLISRTGFESGNLTSDPVSISISLIPTSLTVVLSGTVLSPEESLTVSITLRDVYGGSLANKTCTLSLDDELVEFRTSLSGGYEQVFPAGTLEVGTHTIHAEYNGSLPYASCASGVQTVVVDVPTTLTLNMFSDVFYLSHFVVGDFTLAGNASDPLPGMNVTLSIDGIVLINATTNDTGSFAFSIPAYTLSIGSHHIQVDFNPPNSYWRTSHDEAEFLIYIVEKTDKYPFWPIIPGWGGVPFTASDLFFGQYAYYFWLLVIATIGAVVKALQMHKQLKVRRWTNEQKALEQMKVDLRAAEMDIKDLAPARSIEFDGPPNTPKELIVWNYNSFLRFLSQERKVGIRDSMTHWEIARLLGSLGYSESLVEKMTSLFELARYSGTNVTDTDMMVMVYHVDQLKKPAGRWGAHAG